MTNDDEKATLFNEYFGSVGVVDDGVIPVCHFVPSDDDCVLEMVEFNAQNVLAAMNRLKSNLSSGPDSLPSLLFKRLRHCPLWRLHLLLCFHNCFPCQLCHLIGNVL